MSRITNHLLIFLLVIGIGMLTVPERAFCAERTPGGWKLKVAIEGDPPTLDPAMVRQNSNRLIAQNIFQGLVTFDVEAPPPFKIIPVLAESYQISKDAKMITFKLRKGVQWHHGYGEFTSEDVIFSFQRHKDPKVASLARDEFVDVDKIETPDKYTVILHLKAPTALNVLGCLAWQNAGFIASKNAFLKLGNKIDRIPIGTGPYCYDKWDPGERFILKKFEGYWRARAKINEIECLIIPEQTVALGAIEKGDIDVTTISQMGSYNRAKNIKNIYIAQARAGAWHYQLLLNHRVKPTTDVRVRRALAHAIDHKTLANRLGPLVHSFPSPMPKSVFGATDEFWAYEYSPDKAKKLLAEAGYPKGFELQMLYYKADIFEPIVLEVQRYWREVVDVKLELSDSATFAKKMEKFDPYNVGLWVRGRLIPAQFSDSYETGNRRNYSGYSNPKVDEVIRRAFNATTEIESRPYWRDFQRLVTEDVAMLWPVSGTSLVAIRNGVKGVGILSYAGIYDFEGAYIE